MPKDLKVDYLELPGSDFDALEAFYSRAFDWKFVDYGPEYRSFSDGTINGGFFLSALQSRVDGGSALVVIYAIDLERTLNSVATSGGRITREIFPFPGGRRFHFFDPHGNELAVWSDK